MATETRVTAGAELGTTASKVIVTPHGPVADQHSAFVTGDSVAAPRRSDRIEALKELAQRARRKVRDWWRGYSADDLRTLDAKLSRVIPPGSVIQLSLREYRAYLAVMREAALDDRETA